MLSDVGHPQDPGRALTPRRGHGARGRGYGRLVQSAGGARRAQDGEQHWEQHQAVEQAEGDGEAEHLQYPELLRISETSDQQCNVSCKILKIRH